MSSGGYIFGKPPSAAEVEASRSEQTQEPTAKRQRRFKNRNPTETHEVSNGIEYLKRRNIRLETPADIEAWIAERKRNWPTAAKIKEKEEQQKDAANNEDTTVDGETAAVAASSSEPASRTAQTSTSVCRYYARGHCYKKDKCPFAHVKGTTNASGRNKPGPAKPTKGRVTLFQKLLKTQTEHENLFLLEFFKAYLDQEKAEQEAANKQELEQHENAAQDELEPKNVTQQEIEQLKTDPQQMEQQNIPTNFSSATEATAIEPKPCDDNPAMTESNTSNTVL
ncbi:ribosome assembly protein [Schizosaccharomyces japonicus yFS275]|uniref:Ribosome assembly protein n=1 Tax=Schizosaccharomyces japonicus (strain yFS275 / FY16936) TaxID=402676 RepID=T0T6D3_SCHJY|nr:ribosome assembly protein [Schizosaccharomyces japonicus yFS275]EQC52984.1 ribosome assembly protein [Schizosaccharomyces japonicus yFS275]